MKRLIALAGILFFIATPALAATFASGDTLSIRNPINDDYYVGGGTVTIDSKIEGDLLAAGGTINVSGDVQQDVMVAGGTVNVDGRVGDDLRVAGGAVTVTSNVADDVVIAGGNIKLAQGATASGDMLVAGGEVEILGRVRGNLKVRGGSVTLRGTVGGNLDMDGGTLIMDGTVAGTSRVVVDKLDMGSTAKFGKDVTYWTKDGQVNFASGAVAGSATYDPTLRSVRSEERAPAVATALAGVFSLFGILSAALLILLLLFATRTFFPDAAAQLRKEPWWDLFYGFVYLVLTPFAALLLMITIFGFPLGLFLLFYYLFSFAFIGPVSALLLANLAKQYYGKDWGRGMLFLVAIGFYIALKLLNLIPIIGWLAKLLLYAMIFGALCVTKLTKAREIL